MSCIFCKKYNGIGEECDYGVIIQTTSESIICTEYEYNGSVNYE